MIVVGRGGSVEVAQGADTHLLEGEVEVCIGGHGCLVGNILCRGTAGDVDGGEEGLGGEGRDSSGWCSRAR